jgi:hypothetical protein
LIYIAMLTDSNRRQGRLKKRGFFETLTTA